MSITSGAVTDECRVLRNVGHVKMKVNLLQGHYKFYMNWSVTELWSLPW